MDLKRLKLHFDIRELLLTKASRTSAHNPATRQKRPTVQEHISNFEIEESLKIPEPKVIIIFDDVITTGASFKAAQTFLKIYFPNVTIAGVFIARALNYMEKNLL